jgi:DNA-binding beta-propeller fold protein YncE
MPRVRLQAGVLGVTALPLLFAWQAEVAAPRRAVSPSQPPAGGARLFKSGPIQITADGRWVEVADAHADAVARIDTRTASATSFPLPDPAARDLPRGLAVTEDGAEVWVAAHDADRVYVLDGSDGQVRAQIELPWGSGPYSVALSPPQAAGGRQAWALVTLHRSAALAAIDTTTRAVTLLAPVFRSPFGIA